MVHQPTSPTDFETALLIMNISLKSYTNPPTAAKSDNRGFYLRESKPHDSCYVQWRNRLGYKEHYVEIVQNEIPKNQIATRLLTPAEILKNRSMQMEFRSSATSADGVEWIESQIR